MDKKLFLLLVPILLLPTAQAVTTYDIRVEGSKALVNVTFELYTPSPGEKVNYWSSSFSVPHGSEILDIRDSIGPISEYNLEGNMLFLETNKGGVKEKEVVTMVYRTGDIIDSSLPTKKLNVSLAAFSDSREDVPDEKTFVTIRAGERLLSFIASFGFVSQIEGDQLLLAGDGPVSVNVFFGDGGKEYEHYVLFGKGDLTKADKAYGMISAVTGIVPEYDKHPVVVLNDNEYEKVVNDWSAGLYKGGVIFVSQSEMNKSSFTGTIMHETAHAFNDLALRWHTGKVTWFDEGVAKYIEFLYNKKAGVRQPEIFGKALKWQEGLIRYSLPPRSSSKELWDYYLDRRESMRLWNTDDPSTREFGYAYSELVIRDFIQQKGEKGLHPVFQKLLKISEETGSPDVYNEKILSFLGSDFHPCQGPQDEFEACLEAINAIDPPIPRDIVIKGVKHNITIPRIQASEEEPFWMTAINYIVEFFAYLIGMIRGAVGI